MYAVIDIRFVVVVEVVPLPDASGKAEDDDDEDAVGKVAIVEEISVNAKSNRRD